jgi:hypothetical protein
MCFLLRQSGTPKKGALGCMRRDDRVVDQGWPRCHRLPLLLVIMRPTEDGAQARGDAWQHTTNLRR